jgi:NAD(P)-dependent dehydrogenase (short-subunit alcohol dehydrogenase family)
MRTMSIDFLSTTLRVASPRAFLPMTVTTPSTSTNSDIEPGEELATPPVERPQFDVSKRETYWIGKVALVTGSSSGLGLAVAEAFARAGASVVTSARSADTLETAAEELRKFGGEVLAVPADVTQPEQVDALFEQAIARFGRLDVLVNNVGKSARGTALETTPDEFARLLELNFLSAVRCTRAAAPHLVKTRGHLVNIGSLSGKSASRYLGAYSATKFALAAYTQQLRLEMSDSGLHVLLVSPGPIERDDAGHRYADQMQGLPASAAKPGGGAKIPRIRPERLAAEILRACRRRQPELIYPWLARVFIGLIQLFPRFGDWLIRRIT